MPPCFAMNYRRNALFFYSIFLSNIIQPEPAALFTLNISGTDFNYVLLRKSGGMVIFPKWVRGSAF